MSRISISKDGLLMGFCYPFKPLSEKAGLRNGCSIFWKMLFMIPFWPLYLTLKAFDILIIRGVGSVFAFVLFGYRPVTSFRWVNIGKYDYRYKRQFGYRIFVPIKKWPIKAYASASHRKNIALWHIISVTSTVLFIIIVFVACSYAVWYFFVDIVFGTSAGRTTVGVIAFTITAVFSVFFLADCGFWDVLSEYVKAKKEKYCPIIEVK